MEKKQRLFTSEETEMDLDAIWGEEEDRCEEEYTDFD